MEELVGRAVKKAFPGFGVFDGVVESYDAEAGYFRVLYEDGDSEEVDAEEMSDILVGPAMLPQPETPGGSAGRRPKKRRRGDEESPQGNVLVAVDVADADGLLSPAERRRDGVNGETLEKKRRVDPGPESARPVRRSARQAKAAALAAEMDAAVAVAEAAESEAAAALAPVLTATTPQQSVRKRQRANGSGRYRSVAKELEDAALDRLPPKPELPPSSQGLDLEGLHVLDVFQTYSCLRSFSRQLFLSPFTLETFVAALRCTYVNPLVDWVHFALLRALKSHLEDLAHEGDPSAIHCIRNLNWELLDLATWPIYLAEYLLTRGSELRYGMKLTDLKLLNTEYYRQPAAVKLELLSSLCDAVLDIEAIRSELGSRMSELDGNDEGCRSSGVKRKGRDSSVKGLSDSSLPLEGSDDMDDGNSDECYLCGMDGNLLCCDGCPAAFHSKCVGVVEDLLPEGDWHCPECLVQKNDGSRNMAKLVRGADILGVDPHGRLYFSTCSYLLVVESCDADYPCHYYGQLELHALVTVLISCHPSYNSIGKVISSFRGIAIEASNFNGRYENSKECSTSAHETDCRQSPLKQHSECRQYEIEKDGSSEQLDSRKACASNSDQFDQNASHQNFTIRSAPISENDNEISVDEKLNQASQHKTPSANKDSCNSQQEDVCLHAKGLSAENQKDPSSEKRACDYYIHSDPTKYINYYSFGQIAASAAGELKHKLSEHEEGKKPGLDAVSLRLKTICKKYVNVFALTDQKLSADLLKEKCGWCNSCQISGGSDCIFRVTDGKRVENLEPSAVGLWLKKKKEYHIVLAMHNILSIEERLNGLLSGPWQNPQYSIDWRSAVLNSSDVSSLKQPLLMLESSLRRVAFSAEWHKPADSVEVIGSAAHILVRTSNKSSSYATPKKPGRKPSNGELKVDSRDVGVYWWRGGTLSRQVFHWKRLPQSLACKAARQAGRKKIPTISYPDSSQFARRLKYIAWRAAVEMAQNASQLILQIKELELNIKWNEILSTLSSALATKETHKIARLFKKVIIRRKRIDGTNVEYLLDFGKRENIPPIVAKNGIKFEEPSSERNRYWLSEGHVPLSLLKSYEAKAVTRLLKKKDSNNLPKKMANLKPKKLKRSVFDELLEKVKKLPSRLCGQCFKEVITSEAANCQYCDALFHRKHFKVPRGTVDALYVCNKCLTEKVLPVKSPQKKALSKKSSPKKKQKKRTRKIVTRTQIVINLKKKASRKKGKRGRPRKNPLTVSKNQPLKVPENQPSNEPKNEPVKRISKRLYDKYMKGNSNITENAASCHKRRRTALHYSYWLDGLRWTQSTDDERARSFRKERVVFPPKDVEISEVSPVCSLCKQCYSKDAIYVSCEDCEDWFHGVIYSITMENVNNLIGFKCHGCRLRAVPVCPYAQTGAALKDQSDREDSIDRSVENKDHNCRKDLSNGLKELHDHNIEKELHGHSIEKQVGDHNCLKVLEAHSDLEELDSHSTKKELNFYERKKKELNDCNYLKETENHNNMKELDSHSTEKGFHDHNNLNDGYNCLSKLGNHNNVKDFINQSTPEEPGSTEGNMLAVGETQCLKELDNHNGLKDLDNHNNVKYFINQSTPEEPGSTEGNMFAVGETQCLKELDNHNGLKDLDNHNRAKDLHNHSSLDELNNYNSLKELDNHISLEELDSHNCPKELANQNSLKDLDNNKSLKDLDSAEDGKLAAVTHTDDFLDEQFNKRISSEESWSKSAPVKESIA